MAQEELSISNPVASPIGDVRYCSRAQIVAGNLLPGRYRHQPVVAARATALGSVRSTFSKPAMLSPAFVVIAFDQARIADGFSNDGRRIQILRSNSAIASQPFAVGGLSQLALLDTEREELQTSLDRTKVQAQRLADTAALYQALGARP